jgi:hypothetical protein
LGFITFTLKFPSDENELVNKITIKFLLFEALWEIFARFSVNAKLATLTGDVPVRIVGSSWPPDER